VGWGALWTARVWNIVCASNSLSASVSLLGRAPPPAHRTYRPSFDPRIANVRGPSQSSWLVRVPRFVVGEYHTEHFIPQRTAQEGGERSRTRPRNDDTRRHGRSFGARAAPVLTRPSVRCQACGKRYRHGLGRRRDRSAPARSPTDGALLPAFLVREAGSPHREAP